MHRDAADQAAVGAGVDDASDDSADVDAAVETDGNRRKKPSAWERLIAERTPLSTADRKPERWTWHGSAAIYKQVSSKLVRAGDGRSSSPSRQRCPGPPRYVRGRSPHRQGRPQNSSIDGIRKKQLKDYVRLLGLYPLAAGASARRTSWNATKSCRNTAATPAG